MKSRLFLLVLSVLASASPLSAIDGSLTTGVQLSLPVKDTFDAWDRHNANFVKIAQELTSGASTYVNVTGDTMTGDLTVPNVTVTAAASVGTTLAVTGVLSLGAPIAVYARTSTQLASLTPAASGQLVINITNAWICTSSGTTGGAWILPSTATSANWKPCY